MATKCIFNKRWTTLHSIVEQQGKVPHDLYEDMESDNKRIWGIAHFVPPSKRGPYVEIPKFEIKKLLGTTYIIVPTDLFSKLTTRMGVLKTLVELGNSLEQIPNDKLTHIEKDVTKHICEEINKYMLNSDFRIFDFKQY